MGVEILEGSCMKLIYRLSFMGIKELKARVTFGSTSVFYFLLTGMLPKSKSNALQPLFLSTRGTKYFDHHMANIHQEQHS